MVVRPKQRGPNLIELVTLGEGNEMSETSLST